MTKPIFSATLAVHYFTMGIVNKNLFAFLAALVLYVKRKLLRGALLFEAHKRLIVGRLLWKRGALYRPFVHAGMVFLTVGVILVGGAFSGNSLVGSAFSSVPDERVLGTTTDIPSVSLSSLESTTTNISDKPRDAIIEYVVQGGDTLSSIAQKHQIDVDTVRWANDLGQGDVIKPGQTLKILPVPGIAHKVVKGDTIYSIAKKYGIDPQPILNFPFNDIGDDLSLQIGVTLIVPGGEPPRPAAPPRQQYFAEAGKGAPESALGKGIFVWPVSGQLTQFYAWYHRGLDIANNTAPGIAAADAGRVIVSGWPDNQGYGNRIVIDHGNGHKTLYAHLSRLYVSVGDYVKKGDIIGQMGSTGRSTGTHLHFEIYQNGTSLNPLSFLK